MIPNGSSSTCPKDSRELRPPEREIRNREMLKVLWVKDDWFKDLWIVTHLSSFYSRVPKYFGDHEIMNEEKVREVKMEPALELSTVPSDHMAVVCC